MIAYIQAGYLGRWGEWNWDPESGYTKDNAPLLDNIAFRKEIIDWVIDEYDRVGIMQHVELRRPVFAHEIEQRNLKQGNPPARIGFHNDCFMTTTSDMGTYSNFDDCDPSTNPDCPNFATSEEAKAWAQSFTENASFGGETCPEVPTGSERWLLCSNMTGASSEPASLHMNYLNRDFSEKAVETWEKGDAQGNVCYDEIRRRLGYRFEVRSVEYTKDVSDGGTFSVAVDVENTGCARLHKPRVAKLVLRNGATPPLEYMFLGGHVSNWAPGTTTTLSVSDSAPPPGTYSVWLGVPDPDLLKSEDYPGAKINYAVKLATLRDGTNVFRSDTAENDLGVEITVHNEPTTTRSISVGPTRLSFGNVVVGDFRSKSFTIANVGTDDVTVTLPTLPPFSFRWDHQGSFVVKTGSRTTVSVEFNPKGEGLIEKTLTFTSNAPESPHTISLSGRGIGGQIP